MSRTGSRSRLFVDGDKGIRENMQRRDFLKLAGLSVGSEVVSPVGLLTAPVFAGAPTDSSADKDYGMLECADPRILAALVRSGTGILRCTVNDQTHCCDAGFRWGTDDAINDLYFGLYGGLFTGGAVQHAIFQKELRKFGRHVNSSPDHPPVPWSVSADGTRPKFNSDAGFDLDRSAEFVLQVVRIYEATGDRQFATDLYPKCVEVVNYLAARDFDGDLLPEGRTQVFSGPIKPGGSASSSVTYIGDSCANAWKDFGAALFYYEALRRLALLETILGRNSEASLHLEQAGRVRNAGRRILWNDATSGFLAWVDRNGTVHDDWITGNNLHAVASGFASHDQSLRILAKLGKHRAEIEEIIPCRVRLGIFQDGLCSNQPEDYWNGGIWPLVSAPDMRATAALGDVPGALRIAELLATHPKVTNVGFYEAYDGTTGKPNNCRGLLMNNGGFIWGFMEAVMGIEMEGDELRFRASVPRQITPARARIRHRNCDVEVAWKNGSTAEARLDGAPLTRNEHAYYTLTLAPNQNQTHHLEIVTEDISSGQPLT